MAISALLDAPFFTGGSSTSAAPKPYPIAINGRGYVPDFSFPLGRRLAYSHQTIDMLRAQADTSNVPGEASLNPEGLWRRSQSSWHLGAGQSYLDRDGSDASRFRTSKGINPWTKFQMSLLNDTANRRASANTNLYLAAAGAYLYVTDGVALQFTQDMSVGSPSFTAVTGMPAGTPTSIASDGNNVYVACTADGLYTTTRGAAAVTQLVTTALASDSVVRYVKGRLMVSKGAAVYNVTSAAPAALPGALFTQANTDFTWVGFAEGPANIYMAGFSGDKSLIYRTGILSDGTALAAPVVAGELPSGEIVRSIKGYLGFLLVGSDKGVRFCNLDANGNIVLGDLIPTTSAVRCFEPNDRFVWYGLTNYDTSSTGLGRLDLRNFNSVVPAYASDLMATAQGTVQAAVTFQSMRVFSVQGVGFFSEVSTKVPSGTLDSGFITYGIADQKVAVYLRTDTLPLVGTIKSSLSQDGGAFTTVGTMSIAGTVTAENPTNQALTSRFEIRETLSYSGVSDTVGPTLLRHTLRANPAAATGFNMGIVIRLATDLLVGGVEVPCVPSVERAILDDLRLSRRVVLFQEGSATYSVTVEGLHWLPESVGRDNFEFNGALVVTLKTLA